MRSKRMPIILAVAATAAFPSAAIAKTEPGVHTDPGSPGGKEYAIPIDKARQLGHRQGGSSHGSTPLFGQGLTPRSRGAGASGSSAPAAQAAASSGSTRPSLAGSTPRAGKPETGRSGGQAVASAAGAARARADSPRGIIRAGAIIRAGSDGPLLAILGGGALVLIAGGLGGLFLRRRAY